MKHLRNEEALKIDLLITMSSDLWLMYEENFENFLTSVTFQLHPDIPQSPVHSSLPVLLVAPVITFFVVISSFRQIPKSVHVWLSLPQSTLQEKFKKEIWILWNSFVL